MEKPLARLYESIQKLVGIHRRLLDCVRLEHDVLVEANIKRIQETTLAKQALIEELQSAETERLKLLAEVGRDWKKPLREITLNSISIAIQGEDPKGAEQFRSAYNVLTLLLQRIVEQNATNRTLVERSLSHVAQMKKNILGEANPSTNTYTSQGQKSGVTAGARLISKEA